VPREHDQVLAGVVRAAADSRSEIAVLVGGSPTGKTRACWEALGLLRSQEPGWLWHPIDPTRPDSALRELPGTRSPAKGGAQDAGLLACSFMTCHIHGQGIPRRR
jgi:hypothetical protein